MERASYAFPWSEGVFRDCVRVGYLCRVIEAAGEVGGYGIMSCGAGEAHILNICVRGDLRSGGVGRRLMDYLLERARELHMQDVFLEVRPSNPIAIRLYETLGFARVGVRKGYYQAPAAARTRWSTSWCSSLRRRRSPLDVRSRDAPERRRSPTPDAGVRRAQRSRGRPLQSRATPMQLLMPALQDEISRRRTFAIISHPDAGKTTLTEKLLLFGGAIQLAGTVKGRKAARHATSDWMALEQQRGISVTSSVMQFPYDGRMVNLLDTPGHEDFSEDTYRTLTAVDSALMVIDCAKGVEERTIKLMEVCRLRDTPIMTFINKLDREGREPMELLDEIEKILKISCAPVTWPIGMGRELQGIYHMLEDRIYIYQAGEKGRAGTHATIDGLGSAAARSSSAIVCKRFVTKSSSCAVRRPHFDVRNISPVDRRRCSSVRRSTISASPSCCRRSCAMRQGRCRARRRAATWCRSKRS